MPSRLIGLGVLRGDPQENLAAALHWTLEVRRYAEWVKQYLAGPALAASLERDFDAEPLWGALATVERETTKLRGLFTQEGT